MSPVYFVTHVPGLYQYGPALTGPNIFLNVDLCRKPAYWKNSAGQYAKNSSSLNRG
jgi:hypothetical protein